MPSLLILGLIGFIGFLCQWLSQRVKLPAILFLLLAGIVLGPVLSVVDPDKLFGDLLFPFISLSVAVILFEGALTLERSELKEIGKPVRRMLSIGVAVSLLLMTLATHYIMQLDWAISALFGAIMVVTGPTVIMPMLRAVRPQRKIADVLRWEGIVIDPIGALIAVLVFEWIVVQQSTAAVSEIFYVFGSTVFVGMAIGAVSGYLFGLLLRHHFIPERLTNYAALASVCLVFAVSDSLLHESGLLAVTIMGIWLANMRDVHVHSILEFKEDLTIVFVSALFIVLAARLDISEFLALGFNGLLLLAAMQFLVRPIKVALSFIGTDFNWREKALVAWIGPRGIVAAAVSVVFALKLENVGLNGADKLVPLAFMIIIGTVVFQSLTAKPVARLLNVTLPKTQGVLIIGANKFSIMLAQALARANIESLICDTSWDKLRAARILGLKTYYGNPSSEHASKHFDMTPYGFMTGLSNHFEYNVTQANRYREEFGTRNVFILPPNQATEKINRHVASARHSGRLLFDEHSSFNALKKKLNNGYVIKITELKEEYKYKHWLEKHPDSLMLFLLKPSGELVFNTIDTPLYAETGSKLFYLSSNGEVKDPDNNTDGKSQTKHPGSRNPELLDAP